MSWRKVKLGELCIIEKGNIGITKAIDGEFPLVVTGEERKSHNEYQFDDEAVIIPLVSSTGHGHKSLKRIHYQKGKFAVGNILCAVIPKNKSVLNAYYLYRYLTLNKERELVSRMKGMANVTLPIKEIESIEIPLPDLEEQLRLVGIINNVEQIKEKLTIEQSYQLDLIKKLRQQFLQDAIQGKLAEQNKKDEPASELLKRIKAEKEKLIKERKLKKEKELPPIKPEEIPFKIPDNWIWCRLGEICSKIGSGSTPKGSNYSAYGKPFFRSQNIYDFGLVYDDIKHISDDVHKLMSGTIVYANDILLNITGGSLGRCSIVPDDFNEGNVSQHVCIIRPLLINKYFLHKVILSPYFQKFIFSSTTGAGREGLPKYNLEKFVVPVPPLSVQNKIVKKIEELMQSGDELEDSIKQSISQNENLLQQVLREALQPKKIVDKAKTIRKPSFSNQKLLAFYQKQILAHIIQKHHQAKMPQGEVVIAKDTYHLEKFYGVNTFFNYQNLNFGTYDPKINELLTGKDKFFKSETIGKKGYKILNLAENAQELFSDTTYKEELEKVDNGMDELLLVYSKFEAKDRTKQIELLNTVSKVIADIQSLEINSIRKAMTEWKTPKAEFKNKAEKFTLAETKECLKLILEKGWDKKLL